MGLATSGSHLEKHRPDKPRYNYSSIYLANYSKLISVTLCVSLLPLCVMPLFFCRCHYQLAVAWHPFYKHSSSPELLFITVEQGEGIFSIQNH